MQAAQVLAQREGTRAAYYSWLPVIGTQQVNVLVLQPQDTLVVELAAQKSRCRGAMLRTTA
jgi:hypothetical protein